VTDLHQGILLFSDEAHVTFGASECLLVREIDSQQVGA
jgi:hypothetical protein